MVHRLLSHMVLETHHHLHRRHSILVGGRKDNKEGSKGITVEDKVGKEEDTASKTLVAATKELGVEEVVADRGEEDGGEMVGSVSRVKKTRAVGM